MDRDTIFALATPPGKSGVAVIRLSGPHAYRTTSELLRPDFQADRPRVRQIWSRSGEHIDTALILPFDAGASFTSEETVEFHVHGSPAVIRRVLGELSTFSGVRPAMAGEFTRRALENQRLSLDAVEGLADLIDAETEAQRVQALRVASGALRERTDAWRHQMIEASALIEAGIDFADEELPEDLTPEIRARLDALHDDLCAEAAGAAAAERIREGFEVAIIGPPNAGKSTLLNRLSGREAALISSTPGTTRDVIEVRLDLRGLPVTFLDTAGLRETEDEVERMGVLHGQQRAAAADLRIILTDPTESDPSETPSKDDIVVTGKADLYPGSDGISGKTGLGIDALVDAVARRLEKRAGVSGLVIRERQAHAVRQAAGHVLAAREALDSDNSDVAILAEQMRQATQSLEEVTGRIGVEDVLDQIFSRFCIGK